ncbi:MAG TPA: PIN domain-containing protein [Tepidisphaeraceae bacterium]|nr:PIN domain-containing protein [Tepidisphaeraceae bacterium]
MSPTAEDVIAAYATKGLLIDSHMVLLYVVGSHDKTLISRFKRTQTYTPDDFDTLDAVLSLFSRIVVTPHIFAEVNSLLRQLPEAIRDACFASSFLEVIQVVDEVQVASKDAAVHEKFPRLGLTDCAICSLAGQCAILTDDLPLYGNLAQMGAPVINFTHLRNFT